MKILPIILLLFASLGLPALAVDPVNKSRLNSVAIKGYDPVAYHTRKKAVKGSKDHQFTWKGAKWRFSSAENLAMFKAAPEKYAPRYGGWCAYAVSQNNTASIDPDMFTLVGGKLYLNYNMKIKEKWLKDRDAYIRKADANWPALLRK